MTRARIILFAVAVCLLAGTVLYARALDNGFRADDFVFLRAAYQADSPAGILSPHQSVAFFRPGAFALFLAEQRLFGLNASAYLAFNILLHILNAGLCYLVLRRLDLDRDAALLAAGLFYLGVFHYGKEVTWACTSGGLAMTALLAAAVLPVAAAGAPRGASPRAGWAATYAACLLAPFFHESGLAAPLVVLAAVASRRGWRGLCHPAVAALAPVTWGLWIVATLLDPRTSALAHSGAINPFPLAWTACRYLGLAVLPVQSASPLAGGHPAVAGATVALQRLQPFLGLAFVLWVLVAWIRRAPARLRILGAWALLAIAPYTLVPLPAGWLELRYLYGAAAPLAALLACLVVPGIAASRPWRRAAAMLVLAVAIVGSAALGMILERKSARASSEPGNRARLEALRAEFDPGSAQSSPAR
ncbi:MAG: hypothetical protein JW819_04920 [Candidatus Krumholzibacteriota bacterium]|nr:hypothetical protein [Candidatus Krumholzibacteriota bacterium]